MGVFKLLSIVSVLAAIIIAAYLYVTHLDNNTQPTKPASSAAESADKAVDDFNQQSQKRLQDAASDLSQ